MKDSLFFTGQGSERESDWEVGPPLSSAPQLGFSTCSKWFVLCSSPLPVSQSVVPSSESCSWVVQGDLLMIHSSAGAQNIRNSPKHSRGMFQTYLIPAGSSAQMRSPVVIGVFSPVRINHSLCRFRCASKSPHSVEKNTWRPILTVVIGGCLTKIPQR